MNDLIRRLAIIFDRHSSPRNPVLAALMTIFFLSLPLFPEAQPVRDGAGDLWADRILGQADTGNLATGVLNAAFGQVTPNQPDSHYLFNPGGVLVDAAHDRMFVYDSGNNRVLVYNSLANALSNADAHGMVNQGADAVLGQLDFHHSSCNWDSSSWNYPNLPSANAACLCTLNPRSQSVLEADSQATMAVDPQGNLYVTDYYNNRVLRYSPGISGFANGQTADHVWGQTDFTGYWYNQNLSGVNSAPTSFTLGLFNNSVPGNTFPEYVAGVAIDPWGNLWVADEANNRVLRFPNLGGSAPETIADVVLGQGSFTTSTASPVLYQNIGGTLYGYNDRTDLTHIWMPTSVRVDGYGNVYVSDILEDGRPTSMGYGSPYGNPIYIGRVLVYTPKSSGGHGPSYNVDGSADYAVTQYLNVPVGLELDAPVTGGGTGGIWVNDTGTAEAVLFVNNGGVTSSLNFVPRKVLLSDQFGVPSGGAAGDKPSFSFTFPGPLPSGSTMPNPWYFHDTYGGIGVNNSNDDVYLQSFNFNDVWHFPGPQPTPQIGTAHSADARFFEPFEPAEKNLCGNYGMFSCKGVVISGGSVTQTQVIAADIFRLMYWNMPGGGPAGLSNGQPADGIAGTAYPYNQAGNQITRIASDRAGHLWVARISGLNSWVEMYNLPLTNLQSAAMTLGTLSPSGGTVVNLLGGGSVTIALPTPFGNFIYGLAVDPNDPTGSYLWVSDSYNNRVFRIRNPLTTPQVDVILGQSNVTNTYCNDTGNLVGDHTSGSCTQPPSRTGLFSPGALKFDHNHNLYLSDVAQEDVGNGRMLRWNKTTIDNAVSVASGSVAYRIPADMVYGAGGLTNFTVKGGQTPGGICGPWEPGFNSDDSRMVVGNLAQQWCVDPYPVVLQNPLTSDSPLTQLRDYGPASTVANFDDQNNLYVSELNRDRVLIYFQPFPSPTPTPTGSLTPSATPTFTISPTPTFTFTPGCCTSSWVVTYLNNAQDVKIDANNFYICDTFHGKFSIYSKAALSPVSAPVSSISTTASPAFVNPSGVAMDGSGHIFVSDMGDSYVYEFNNDGVYAQLASFNGSGGAASVSGPMTDPRSLWANNAGTTVVVADSEGHEIRVFQKQGATFVPVLKMIQTSYPNFYPFGITDDGTYLYFSDTAYNVVWKYPIDFSAPATAITLTGITQARRISHDQFGNFYVTDNGAGFVVYNSNWTPAYTCTTHNGSSFNQPEGIAVDVDGHVYLSDGYNNQALRMDPCSYFLSFLTPTPTPSSSPTNTPTRTPTNSPTPTLSNTPSATATASLTNSPTNSPSNTPTLTPSNTPTPTFTDTPTISPTFTPASTATNTPTNSPTSTATNIMVNTYTPTITSTPTVTPTPAVTGVVIGVPYPNPVKDAGPVAIPVQAPVGSSVEWSVFTTAFRKILDIPQPIAGTSVVLSWDLNDNWGVPVANGLYFIRVQVTGPVKISKILKVLVFR